MPRLNSVRRSSVGAWSLATLLCAASPSLGQETLVARLSREVEVRERQRLEEGLLPIIDGGRSVYRGRLSAVETTSDGVAGARISGRVVAWLDAPAGDTDAGGARLTVVFPEEGRWLVLHQDSPSDGRIAASRLAGVASTAGGSASCRNCLEDLDTRPDELSFAWFAAADSGGPVGRARFGIRLVGRLERVERREVTLDDVEPLLSVGLRSHLAGRDGPFERADAEATRTVSGELRERVDVPPGARSQTRCERAVRYSGVQFIRADLSRFGVRDLEIQEIATCCLDHGGHGSSEVCQPEGSP